MLTRSSSDIVSVLVHQLSLNKMAIAVSNSKKSFEDLDCLLQKMHLGEINQSEVVSLYAEQVSRDIHEVEREVRRYLSDIEAGARTRKGRFRL